jgi:hypothetical protein
MVLRSPFAKVIFISSGSIDVRSTRSSKLASVSRICFRFGTIET